MDGWMDEWMNEWMDGWMNGWMDEWMNEVFYYGCTDFIFYIPCSVGIF